MRISDWSSDVCSSDLEFGALFHIISHAVRVHRTLLPGREQSAPTIAHDGRIARCFAAQRPFQLLLDVRMQLALMCGPPQGSRLVRNFLQKEIGRASCRERVCQYVWIWVVAVES